MKTKASSTTSAWGTKRCICPCEVSTKIAYGGSNRQLSMYKLHKRVQQLFLSYDNESHTYDSVKEHIEDKIFKILYIISYSIYNNRGLKVVEVWFLLEWSIANMVCIYAFMHSFKSLHLSLSLMTKTKLHRVVVRTIRWFVYKTSYMHFSKFYRSAGETKNFLICLLFVIFLWDYDWKHILSLFNGYK